LTDDPVLLATQGGGVQTLTLNRPHCKNALDAALWAALLNEGAYGTMRDALASEARAQTVNFATADARAAFTAFADKTEQVVTGEWAAT
jgi:hypothetical protein